MRKLFEVCLVGAILLSAMLGLYLIWFGEQYTLNCIRSALDPLSRIPWDIIAIFAIPAPIVTAVVCVYLDRKMEEKKAREE